MTSTYEVTDGAKIYGTFSSQTKADTLKKELKAQGVKARVRIVHEEPKGRKSKSAPDAPRKPVKAKKTARSNPVPKKTSKTPQKPKETPKTGKAVDANAPKDYKGPLIPVEDILNMFEQHVYCTDVETGVTSEVMIKYGTVSVMEKGQYGYDLKAVYAGSEVESDGKYLRVTYKGVDHWFVIHADEKVSAPFVVRRRPAVDYSTCSIEQLADVLYQIQEVHVTNRRWYDRDAPHEPNPVLSKDEILNAITAPEKAVALCDAYLHCYVSSYSEFWGGWDENTISYSDWKAIEKRLAKIRADANESIARSVPAEPPAPVEKPKKSLFKRKSKSKTGLAARDDFLKRIEGPLKKLGMNVVPVTKADFTLVDPAHICMIQFNSRTGESLFGLPGEPSFSGIDISQVRQNLGSYFDADGNPIPARLKADANKTINNAKMPQLDLIGSYTVDPATFKKEIVRANKIGATDWILLYGRGGDLMLSSGETAPGRHYSLNGMRADVGDGNDVEAVSAFSLEYFLILADLMAQADGPCTVDIDNEYPVAIRCSIGDFDVLMMLAPRRIEE